MKLNIILAYLVRSAYLRVMKFVFGFSNVLIDVPFKLIRQKIYTISI